MKVLDDMKYAFPKHEVKVALFFTVGLIAAFFYLGAVRYEVNDDMAITAMLKGLFGLSPSGEGVFISPFLGGLFFFLYKFLPDVSWFSLFLFTGVALACFLGCLTILLSIRTVGGQIAGLLGVVFFISLTAFQINFAAVTLLLWITGCVYLLHAVRRNLPRDFLFWLAASHLAAAYLLRPSLLLLMILLALPLFLTLLFGGERRAAWSALAPLIVVLILSLFSGFINRGGDAYSAYQEFNKIRAEFNDTSRSLRNTRTPQALFAAKWSNEDYLVLQNWWLHDSTFFNVDQIRVFLDENAAKSSIFNIEDVKQNLSEHVIFLLVILFWTLALFLTNQPRQIPKKWIVDLLLYFFLIAVVFLLMGIRFPPRVAYPCFLMLFLNAVIIFAEVENRSSPLLLKMVPPLLFTGFLLYSLIPVAQQKIAEVDQIKETKKYIDQSLLGLLQKNGADSVIVDVSPHILPTNYLPFRENDPILKTKIMPGGWLVGSPVYLDFLQREGLGDRSTAVSAMIDNRRIVFRYWDSRYLPFEIYVKNIFLQHLRERYNPPGSGRNITAKILKDDRQVGNGLIYFQLVTVPVQPSLALPF